MCHDLCVTLDSSSKPAPKITANFVDPEVVKRSKKMTSSINELNQFALFLRYVFYFVFGLRSEEEKERKMQKCEDATRNACDQGK